MILLLCLIAAIAFTAVAVIFSDDYGVKACFSAVSMVLAIIVWVAVFIMGIIAIVANIGVKGQIAANEQLYSSLVYQLENDLYDNDNDIGKLQLYEKVTEWNTDLARGQAMQHDFWFGVFYADIYDGFDFIELPQIGGDTE